MSRGVKIGCAVVAALFVLAGLLCAGGFFLARDWFEDLAADYDERRPQMEADARAVAVGGADACISDGLRRAATCGPVGIKCRVEANVRANMCLDVAVIPPTFCDGVPSQTAILDVSMWGLADCARRGYEHDDQCPQFLAKTVAARCDELR